MQFTQLQAIVQDCRKLIKNVLANCLTEEERGQRAVAGTVRQRRQEIAQIKRAIDIMRAEEKKKRQLNQYIAVIEEEISSIRAFTAKERVQMHELDKLCEKTRLKLIEQKERVVQLAQEEQILKEFECHIEESIKNQEEYATLQLKLQQLSKQANEQKTMGSMALRKKESQLKQLQRQNAGIDMRVTNLAKQISIQEEIINEITQIQQDTLASDCPVIGEGPFSILKKEEQAFFTQIEELNMWERHQIENLIQKRQIEKEKETRKAGSIIRQRFNTQLKRQNQHKARYFNHSADLNAIVHKQPAKQEFKPDFSSATPIHFVSNDRMKELQKHKRIRTRYTEPSLFKQKQTKPVYHTLISEETEFLEPRPSILSTYQMFKQERIESNIHTVKLLRRSNRKRSSQTNKGVALEAESFD